MIIMGCCLVAGRGLKVGVPTPLSVINSITNKEWYCFLSQALVKTYPQKSNFLDGEDGVRCLMRYTRGFEAMRKICINGVVQFESNPARNKHEGCRKVLNEMFVISHKEKLGPEYPDNDQLGVVPNLTGNIYKQFEEKWEKPLQRPDVWDDDEGLLEG